MFPELLLAGNRNSIPENLIEHTTPYNLHSLSSTGDTIKTSDGSINMEDGPIGDGANGDLERRNSFVHEIQRTSLGLSHDSSNIGTASTPFRSGHRTIFMHLFRKDENGKRS
jgi:hypothetical protein